MIVLSKEQIEEMVDPDQMMDLPTRANVLTILLVLPAPFSRR